MWCRLRKEKVNVIKIIEANESYSRYFSFMSEEDIGEFNAAGVFGSINIELMLKNMIKNSSICKAVFYDHEFLALSGVEEDGTVWALTSDEVHKYKIAFHKASIKITNEFLDHCGLIKNFIWAGNKSHYKWLLSLNYTISPIKYYRNGNEYSFFYRMKE